MKTCSKCHQEKPKSDYFMRDKKIGRLHAQCKTCYVRERQQTYKDHYQRYRDQYLQRAKIWNKQRRDVFRTNMISYMSDKACVICGESDMRVLEFDHVDPTKKSFAISQAVSLGYNWQSTLLEMKKCRVLCSNCHKKRTAKQLNWYKA